MAPSGSLEAVEPLRATDHVRHLHDDHCPPHGHSVKSPHAPPRTILSICIWHSQQHTTLTPTLHTSMWPPTGRTETPCANSTSTATAPTARSSSTTTETDGSSVSNYSEPRPSYARPRSPRSSNRRPAPRSLHRRCRARVLLCVLRRESGRHTDQTAARAKVLTCKILADRSHVAT